MQSLTSKGFVKTQFSWQWYYYSLTDEGLAYLREWLHLPGEIVPQTHMKPARPAGRPAGYGGAGAGGGGRGAGGGGADGAYKAPRGDREYRRRDDAGEGKEGPGAEYKPVSLFWVVFSSESSSFLRSALRRGRSWCRCSSFIGVKGFMGVSEISLAYYRNVRMWLAAQISVLIVKTPFLAFATLLLTTPLPLARSSRKVLPPCPEKSYPDSVH